MMRLAQSSVARVRLGSVVLPFLRTCRGYSQAVPQPSTSTDSRREVFVDKVADLDEVLESCSRAKSIALDTEFVKFPCFVPKLQLIQVRAQPSTFFRQKMLSFPFAISPSTNCCGAVKGNVVLFLWSVIYCHAWGLSRFLVSQLP